MEALTTTARQAGLNHEDPMAIYAVEYIKQGEAKGKAEGKAEVAKTMKDTGYPPLEIAKLTGLAQEEIQAL